MPLKFDEKSPVAVWSEKDVMNGQPVDTLVVILRTNGCSWSRKSGCLMCGYNNDCLSSITSQDLADQFAMAMDRHEGQRYMKIYTSGSFLDSDEVPLDAREGILGMAGAKASQVLVESRPEFITADSLKKAVGQVERLEVAIGLESADDDIRARCINKGFGFDDYLKACELLKEYETNIRTYLLLKPPYMTEGGAIEDVLRSIEKIASLGQVISVNPVNVQRRTVVESLWKRGQYRAPWLWSLLEVLRKVDIPRGTRLVSGPSGGGTRRGVHNCGKCDKPILNAVQRFSLDQDAGVFDALDCGCREEWLDLLDVEDLAASTGDLARLSKP